MGPIQNAVGSLVGSVAVGAIAKQSIGKIKEELADSNKALKSTEEDLQLTNEAIDDGINPADGFSFEDSLKNKQREAGMPRNESKSAEVSQVVVKQQQVKTSQKKTSRNRIKELRKILKGGK